MLSPGYHRFSLQILGELIPYKEGLHPYLETEFPSRGCESPAGMTRPIGGRTESPAGENDGIPRRDLISSLRRLEHQGDIESLV